jgi:methyl-accepting chemotaxis protein
MTQVDHVTQKTASAAEELASTAEEMAAQAEALHELLSRVGDVGKSRRSNHGNGSGDFHVPHASQLGLGNDRLHLAARSRRPEADEFRPISSERV